MNKKMVLTLGGGLIVTLLLVVMLQALISPSSKQTEIVEVQKTQILVAANDIPVGDALDDNNMKWIDWPEEAVFSGAVLRQKNEKPTEAASGLLLRSLKQGEPVMLSAIVEETKGNFMAASLSAGMRAMAIRVSAESSAGGFITPGDKVDVIMTYQVRVPSDETMRDAATNLVSRNASQTVLENVRVLAVDQEAKPKDGAKVARTVTLEVDSKGTEILALASSMGELSLVLRRLGDETRLEQASKEPTTDVLVSNVLRRLTAGQGSQESRTIRVYNGPQLQEQVIRARILPMLQ